MDGEFWKAVGKLIESQPIPIVIGIIALVMLLYNSPQYLSIFLLHKRENKRISAEIDNSKRKLDHEIASKKARIRSKRK
jgi:hypothetical protein